MIYREHKVDNRNKNKRISIKMITAVAIIFIFMLVTMVTVNANSVWQESKSITVAGVSKNVNVVYIDPTDKKIEIRPVLAMNQVGRTESLRSMVDRTGAIAAINGTFFNAYTDDRQPHGVIQQNGNLIHSGHSGSVVGFSGANQLSIANLAPKIIGGKNGSWDWPNNWYAWGFNHDTTTISPDAVVIFTPEHKNLTTSGENAISVVVVNNKVTSIVNTHVAIPQDGYVIRIGNQAGDNLVKLFNVGDIVDYRIEYHAETPSGSIGWENMRHSIGAGPILIHKGKVDVDFVRDSMPDPKLTTDVGMRSFIGITSKGTIGIGTVNSVTIRQLAEIVKDLGFIEAMNLDGGASSGLYYDNRMIITPGRHLSNAIVFIKHSSNLPRLNVNGQELFLDVLAYMDFINGDRNRGVTMIPARGVLEQTGATISWDAVAKKVTAVRGEMIVELVVDSDVAKVNGVNKKLDMPAVIKSNRLFVPIRFISEALGDSVDWNQAEFMVYISSKYTSGTINLADILQQANTAYVDKQYEVATKKYQQYVQLSPNVDETTYNRYGWASYNAREFDTAIAAFTSYANNYPNSTGGYYGLAQVYTHNQVGKLDMAELHYRKIVEISPNSEHAKVANEFLQSLGTVLHQANIAYAEGDFAVASDLYTAYITNNPNVNKTAYNNWGWSSYNARNTGVTYIENAELAFKSYSNQFPDATDGYYGLAVTYRLFHFKDVAGNEERIIANYQKVIDIDAMSNHADIARDYLSSIK